MNKTILFAIGLGALVLTSFPKGTQAAQFVHHPDPVAVTEAQYAQLKTETCENPEGGYCIPDFLGSLAHRVVQRVESNDQLYWINTGDGADSVLPYLPDGFYKTGKKKLGTRKYWVVMDGVKRRIKKGNTYARVQQMLANQHGRGISETDFQSLLTSCEYYGGDMIPYTECVAIYNRGQELLEELAGTIVQRVEGDGSLHYIPTTGGNAIELGRRVEGTSLFKFAKKKAQKVSAKKMKNMLPGRLY